MQIYLQSEKSFNTWFSAGLWRKRENFSNDRIYVLKSTCVKKICKSQIKVLTNFILDTACPIHSITNQEFAAISTKFLFLRYFGNLEMAKHTWICIRMAQKCNFYLYFILAQFSVEDLIHLTVTFWNWSSRDWYSIFKIIIHPSS